MIVGDAAAWARNFISVDERLVRRISEIWPGCLAVLPPQPEEDQITINLIAIFNKDPVIRSICHWIEYQFEPFGTMPNGMRYSKGKIDLAVFLDWDRERYLAYECKRLNVVFKNGRQSLATAYVKEGMMRFITEQYAEALPVGCMVGYVIDGDIPFAVAQVHEAIADNHGTLGLISGPVAAPAVGAFERFFTNHTRPGAKTTIELRHALLPFPAGPSGKAN